MNSDQRIVITGLGVLSCVGLGRENFWDSLTRGESGIRNVQRFDASDLPCRIAGELWDFDPQDFMRKADVRRWYRHVHQAIACARLAVEDSDLETAGYDDRRMSVAYGTSVGSPNEAYDEQQAAYKNHGYKKISRFGSTAFSAHAATVNLTIDFGMRGPATTISSGCATGLECLSWGVNLIKSGKADAVLAGATESPIFPMSYASACSLGILSKRNEEPDKAMRPYDEYRDGIVLSEGAAAVTLERADKAIARGARIYGEVLGTGSAAEGRNPLILEEEGIGLSYALQNALEDAHVSPHEIDHIQAHGVSMAMYDRCETNAYKRIFGDYAYRMPISAVKSMIGQAYSAGGMLGLAAGLLALDQGVVTPTINLETPDPACDLDYVSQGARLNDIDTAMITAMSFGGTHSAAVLGRYN